MASELCLNAAVADAVIAPGFCAGYIPLDFGKSRSIVSVTRDSFLTVEQNTQQIRYSYKTKDGLNDSDGSSWLTKTLIEGYGLNHGLALWDNYIYASSASTVYRWPYDDNTFTSIGPVEEIITNMNDDGMGGQPGGHSTRTLAFNSDSKQLYVSVGSNGNVDPNSFRSRIRRFTLQPPYPIDFVTGEVFADGVRNEVGLAFDPNGTLWGVENGADSLARLDLGIDIVQDNPAEELNRFLEADAGKHYGYPYCFTEYNLPKGLGKGTVWAWPSFLSDGTVTDEQCRTEYVPPVLAMQGHSAPLGITFYKWKEISERPPYCADIKPFPKGMDGYAFIAYHGSWNRVIPTGYKVVYVPIQYTTNTTTDNVTTTTTTVLTSDPIDLLAHVPPNAQWENGFRPVDVDFDECGRLLVSSDGTGLQTRKIVRIDSITDEPYVIPPSPAPTEQPTKQFVSESCPIVNENEDDNDEKGASLIQCEHPRTGEVGIWMYSEVLSFFRLCRQRCEVRDKIPSRILRLLRWRCGVCT